MRVVRLFWDLAVGAHSLADESTLRTLMTGTVCRTAGGYVFTIPANNNTDCFILQDNLFCRA